MEIHLSFQPAHRCAGEDHVSSVRMDDGDRGQCGELFEPDVGVPMDQAFPMYHHYYGPGHGRWELGVRDAL